MLFLNAYSCFTSVFYVAFSPPAQFSLNGIFDFVIEFFFLADIVFNFLTTYRDPNTFIPVTSLSKIAKRYVL